MYNNIGDEQYNLNQWCQFKDQKITQFFKKSTLKHNPHKNYYSDFINTLAIIIVRYCLKNVDQRMQILCLLFIMFHLIAAYLTKINKLEKPITQILDIFITLSIISSQRENESEFIIRLSMIIAIQTSKSMLFQYDWVAMFLSNTCKILPIILLRWYFIQDYKYLLLYSSALKILVLVSLLLFYQMIQIIIVANYSYAYKKCWINCEKMKKNNQMIEKLFYELPAAIIIFDSNGIVQFQNALSYKFLPKSVDLISKNYSEEPSKLEYLLMSEDDKQLFKQAFQDALESNDAILVSFAFLGHPMPIKCHLRKQVFNKNTTVEAIFLEKSDEQAIIYDRISQSLQIVKIQQLADILSKPQEKIKQNLLQSLFPLLSKTNYQQTDSIVCNLRNYFKFFADFLQITFKTNPNAKIENDVPEQALVDIVKLHSVLTQLISYIYNEHHRKQAQFGSQSLKQLIQQPQAEKQIQKEVNNFSLISFTVSKGDELQIIIQIDYHNQIQELEMIFSKFNFEYLKNSENRKQELLDDDLTYTAFVHIIHVIYSIGGCIELCERLDNIKIQINCPIRVTNEYSSILLENYIGMGRFDAQSKIYTIQDNFQAFRVKSTTQITSTQRIAQNQIQRVIEETARVQTSLSELKNLTYYKCPDVSYRPNVVSEEEKKKSPNLSPINRPSTMKQTDVANFDIEDKINTQMPQVEKAVSKVLEQLLSEIMTFKGKRINVHFKNSKSKQKSFETSPSNSSAQQTQRNSSVPNLQQFRTPIPEQRETNTSQQSQIPSQHHASIFQKQQNQMPSQSTSPQTSQILIPMQQQPNSAQQNKKIQGIQLLKSLRETDSGKQILNLDQSDGLSMLKVEETTDELKNSIRYIPQPNEEHQNQRNLTQTSQTSLPATFAVLTQGSEKSPCFQQTPGSIHFAEHPLRQVTINEIETPIQQEVIPIMPQVDIKQFYNDVLTFLMLDDSAFAINGLAGMKFKCEKKFDSTKIAADAVGKIEAMLQKRKIYHFIFINIKLPKTNVYQLINDIRVLEKQNNMPRQQIIAVSTDVTEELKQKCLEAGYDDVQEKPLTFQFMEALIESRQNIQPAVTEQIQNIHEKLDEFLPQAKISSFKEIKQKPLINKRAFFNEIFTMFIIDDSSFSINALAAMKFSVKTKVDFSTRPASGIEKIEQMMQKRILYHLIFLKLNLPKKNGFEMLQEIRQLEFKHNLPKQYIIALDTDLNSKKIEDCLTAGFDEAVEKPLHLSQVEALIQKILLII